MQCPDGVYIGCGVSGHAGGAETDAQQVCREWTCRAGPAGWGTSAQRGPRIALDGQTIRVL